MEEIQVLWDLLSQRAKWWVFSGRMTLEEAHFLTQHDQERSRPEITNNQIRACMKRAHGVQRDQLVERCAKMGVDIKRPVRRFSDLISELGEMPERVREAFVRGRLNLVQARYATVSGIRGCVLDQFLRIGAREGLEAVSKKARDTFEQAHKQAQREMHRRVYLKQLLHDCLLDEDAVRGLVEYGTPVEYIEIYLVTSGARS